MVHEDVAEGSECREDEKNEPTLILESSSNIDDELIDNNESSNDVGNSNRDSDGANDKSPLEGADTFDLKDVELDMLGEQFSIWEEENPNESIYEIEVNNILENEFENETESFENENGDNRNMLAIASCSRSGSFRSIGSQSPSDYFRSRRVRYGSDSSRPGSECWSPGYRNSMSTTMSQGDKYRRPSYTCTPFQHRRHYAVRRKAGPNLR